MIKGEDDNYYLFYSRWPDSLKHKNNPTIHKFREKYYLYYMGNYGNGEFWDNRNHQCIGIHICFGTLAYKGGLRVGDVIRSVNGNLVLNVKDLIVAVQQVMWKGKTEAAIWRNRIPLELTLVGRNAAGRSSSQVLSVNTDDGYQKLPPVIWQVQPGDGLVHIGLGYTYSDLFYKVRYGSNLNDKSSWKSFNSRALGMFHLDGLKNGTKYYIQAAAAPQFAGSKSCRFGAK